MPSLQSTLTEPPRIETHAPRAGGGTGNPPPRFLGIFFKHWILTLLSIALSALIALVCLREFGKKTYRAEGTLLYRQLPVPEHSREVYTPPNLQTLAALVRSPQNLGGLCEEFQPGMRLDALEALLKVSMPPNTEMIQIGLDWPHPEEAAAMVQRLMLLFTRQVADLRKATLESYGQSTQNNLEVAQARLSKARKAYQAFFTKDELPDIKTRLDRLQKELQTYEVSFISAQGNKENLLAQLKKQQQILDDVRSKSASEGPGKLQLAEATKLRVQGLKRSLTTEEGRLAEARTSLENKQREMDRLVPLFNSKVITDQELGDVRAEINVLNVRVKTSAQTIQQLREDIDLEEKHPGLGLQMETLNRIRDLEGQLAGATGEAAQVELKLNALRDRVEHLVERQKLADPLGQAVSAAENECQQLEGQMAALRQMQSTHLTELEIIAPAKTSAIPIANSDKKVAFLAFAIPLFLFLGGVVTLEMSSVRWRSESFARKWNLRVLARIASKEGGKSALDGEVTRALSLRLRQYLPESGAVLLFGSLENRAGNEDLCRALARSLVLRGERVLLIDARLAGRPPQADPAMGLFQCLNNGRLEKNLAIQPTPTKGLDVLPAGGPSDQADLLASQPMKDLMEDLRKTYTMIFLQGPRLQCATDTEILAAYAQGFVLVVDGNPYAQPAAEGALRSLQELQVPVLGAVLAV